MPYPIAEILTNAGVPPDQLTGCDITEFLVQSAQFQPAAEVTAYFAGCVPAQDLELGPFTVLSPLSIFTEARQMAPSSTVVRHGYLTIARDASGDVFCVELGSGAVYQLNQDIYIEDMLEPRYDPELQDLPATLPITAQNIAATAEARFDSIAEFLKLAAQGTAS